MFDIVSVDACRLISQTLGHSLWQAGLIAALCWLILKTLPARRAELRYEVTCTGLVAVVCATLLTAATVATSSSSATTTPQLSGSKELRRNDSNETARATHMNRHDQQSVDDSPSRNLVAGSSDSIKSMSDSSGNPVRASRSAQPAVLLDPEEKQTTTKRPESPWPVIIAGIWGAGVAGMLFRLVRVISGLGRLQPSELPVDESALQSLRVLIAEVSGRMKLRRSVRLIVSDRVSVPGIVGTFWPTLLMPPAMLTGVPVEQMRIVIAHELAHARRLDFLVNLAQLLVESLLFFNPAVWWLSRQIRIEREACCDAIAVAATGSAMPVARTLLDVMDHLKESCSTAHSATFASGVQFLDGEPSPKTPTSLFDRVRRIVTPDQRPPIRVPWYTLAGIVAAYACVSVGLYEGADATVQIVRKALSPQERIEKIEKLVASQGELARREGIPIDQANDSETGVLFPDPVTVSGTVRTADGSPLPVPLTVFGTFSGPGAGTTEGFGTLNEPSAEFQFSGQTRGQKYVRGDKASLSIYIGFRRDSKETRDYGPVAVGPFTVRSGQSIENLELVLKPGFEGQLRVVDESSNPIPNAFVSGMFHVDNASSYARLSESQTVTDQEGLTTIPASTSELTWSADIRAPGFQKQIFDLRLAPDRITTVTLQAARPTMIQVKSGITGKPVTGAFAYNILDQGTHNGHGFNRQYNDPRDDNSETYQSRYAPLYRYGPSDSNGRLTLDSLADGNIYEFLIMCPDYGPTVLKGIEAGEKAVDLTVYPELSVSGQIIGDLSRLRTRGRSGQKYLQYRNPDRRSILDADVEVRDGKGYFQIHHLGRGGFWLQLPDRTIARNLTESIRDLVIDLEEPGKHESIQPSNFESSGALTSVLKPSTRRVILTLNGAAPSVKINGQIRAGFIQRDRPGAYTSSNYEIKNRRIEFDVEVPTKIHWLGKDFSGYTVVSESEIEVEAADEPFRATVQLVPAGAVRGEVRLANEELARQFQAYVIPVERIDGFSNRQVRVDTGDAAGEFVLQELPLNHEYQALVIDERQASVAAVLSEPFQLDAAQPVADLKFQFHEGQAHTIQLVDENGKPAIGAQSGGWFYPTRRFSRSGGLHADGNGRIQIRHLSDSMPGRMELHIRHAGGFVGQIVRLDWRNLPETVELKRGVSASGRIVDVETGRGIANARLSLNPQPADAASSYQGVSGSTDEQGRFSFNSLEPINYQLTLYGGVPPRVPLVKNRVGVVEPDYSEIKDGTFPEWHIRGGRNEPYVIEVKIVPKRGLKLAPPTNE